MLKEKLTSIDYEHAEALFLDTRVALDSWMTKRNKQTLNVMIPSEEHTDSKRKNPKNMHNTVYADNNSKVIYLQYYGTEVPHDDQSRWEATKVGIFVENGEITNMVSYKVDEIVGKGGSGLSLIEPLMSFNWDRWSKYPVTDKEVKAKILLAAASTMHNYMQNERDSIRNMNYALTLPVPQVRPS